MKKHLTDTQRFIKRILDENDVKPSWLKKRLPHVDVYYLLSERCSRIDVGVFEEIKTEFRKAGFITSENERTEKYMKQLVKISAVVTNSLGLLNEKSLDYAESEDMIDFGERLKLKEMFNGFRRAVDDELSNAEKVLGIK